MKRNKYMNMWSLDELNGMKEMEKHQEVNKIEFDTCPYCGATMRLRLVQDQMPGNVRQTGYYRATYDAVQYICGFCRSTSPIVYLTAELLDEEKVKERMIKEYIECDCDEDEEEESND